MRIMQYYFKDMFDMLIDSDAVIYIAAGTPNWNASGHGTILISLPEEMTLRMRSVISLAFPHITAVEVTNSSYEAVKRCLPDECFLDAMKNFLYTLIRRMEKGQEEETKNIEEYEEIDTDENDIEEPISEDGASFTPIEELDLSIRAYNSLKRAGIISVEQLGKMSDYDLMHVRNPGRKAIVRLSRSF